MNSWSRWNHINVVLVVVSVVVGAVVVGGGVLDVHCSSSGCVSLFCQFVEIIFEIIMLNPFSEQRIGS